MKILILTLCFFVLNSFQKEGKLLRNQSLKIDMIITDSLRTIDVYQMNACVSTIEVKKSGFSYQSVEGMSQFDHFTIHLWNEFNLSMRNATPCHNGSTSWLDFNSDMLVRKINIGQLITSVTNTFVCEKRTTRNIRFDRDTTVATKM